MYIIYSGFILLVSWHVVACFAVLRNTIGPVLVRESRAIFSQSLTPFVEVLMTLSNGHASLVHVLHVRNGFLRRPLHSLSVRLTRVLLFPSFRTSCSAPLLDLATGLVCDLAALRRLAGDHRVHTAYQCQCATWASRRLPRWHIRNTLVHLLLSSSNWNAGAFCESAGNVSFHKAYEPSVSLHIHRVREYAYSFSRKLIYCHGSCWFYTKRTLNATARKPHNVRFSLVFIGVHSLSLTSLLRPSSIFC